jgi:hypothetical protein
MGVAVVKNTLARSAMQNVVDQWIVASKASATLPATTTQNLFTISGGRVLVKGLIGEVTTVVQAQACNLKVSVDPSGGGTTYDVAANLDINADEAGTLYSVEGDGTALLGASAGAVTTAIGNGFVCNPGTVLITTSATNTGATKWDLYYVPAARVVSA